MNRWVRIGAFLFGAVVLAILVVRSGPAIILHTLATSGWVIAPMCVLWGVVYACNTRAWQLLVPERNAKFTFRRAYLLTVSSFAMNYATPFLALGGEPLKISGARLYMDKNRAVGSVIGFRFLHAIAHIIVFFLAIIPAAILLPHTPLVLGTCAVAAVLLALAGFALVSQHRDGIFERGVGWMARFGPLKGVAARLEKHRPALLEFDRELTAIHREGTWPFVGAVLTELTGRVLCTFEYSMVLYSFGFGFDVLRGFVIANLSSLFTNLFFFIPFEMGTKEGGGFLIFTWLGLDPALGTAAALLSRVRELVWMAIGLGCLLLLEDAKPALVKK